MTKVLRPGGEEGSSPAADEEPTTSLFLAFGLAFSLVSFPAHGVSWVNTGSMVRVAGSHLAEPLTLPRGGPGLGRGKERPSLGDGGAWVAGGSSFSPSGTR